MPELGTCDACGKQNVMVHGNDGSGFGRRLMLCDDCCPCYNHMPGGKYFDVRMDGKKRVDVEKARNNSPAEERAPCYWCGKKDHDPKDCPTSDEEKLRRCFQAIAGPLIEGDYIGPMRGEVNVCLNVIHMHLAFDEAAKEILGQEKYEEIRQRAYQIRSKKYGRLLW